MSATLSVKTVLSAKAASIVSRVQIVGFVMTVFYAWAWNLKWA
jgi:hypothetical protein